MDGASCSLVAFGDAQDNGQLHFVGVIVPLK